ncbi:cellulose binding domain-containing protein [Actinoplanes sp. G11-F43]|uniref:cellulose binding domain-containing protein n=1 Tax=Actinoplanes sp. G11-F43 TaxID=3424130 RepID=UPI003D339703
MAKHATRQFILARLIFGSAAAVLLALVAWIAVRAGGGGDEDTAGKPVLIQPTGVLQAAAEGSLAPSAPVLESGSVSPSASASPSPSASASASRSPSASASASASPKPSKSAVRPSAGTSPSRSASPTPAPDAFAASYGTSASWREGFIAAVRVSNSGSEAREWTVTLTFPSSADVEVRGAWNASVSRSGDTVTLRGRSLAAGQSITAGFQADKETRDPVKPVSCAVGGGSCKVS